MRRMINISVRPILGAVALSLVPLAPAMAPANAAAAPTARDTLSAVQGHLRSLSTLVADFTQTDRKGQVLTGTLTLKQPGRIRFQYEKSAGLLIVSDGKSLNMIDYQVNQVQRWPIRNSPLGALLDPGRDISRYGRVIQNGDQGITTVEVRDPAHPEYGVIQMVFVRKAGAPAGLELYGWAARDAQNNLTSIRLSNQRYGARVPDSAFNWRDPRRTVRKAG